MKMRLRLHETPGILVSTMINVWTKYGKPLLNGNRETDLIMKT
jgi:hypothetical protein